MRRLIVALAAVVSFSLSAVAQQKEGEDRGYIVKVGQMAPDFILKTDDGQTVRLSDLRGKVVMLQFTASWCGVCRKEMPHIESEIWQRFKSESDFALYGVDREEPIAKVEALRKATGVTYPILMDTKGKAFRLYAYPDAGITRNVLIDREGKIVFMTRLYNEKEFAALCGAIAEQMGTNR